MSKSCLQFAFYFSCRLVEVHWRLVLHSPHYQPQERRSSLRVQGLDQNGCWIRKVSLMPMLESVDRFLQVLTRKDRLNLLRLLMIDVVVRLEI